jgi:hypothetical protein
VEQAMAAELKAIVRGLLEMRSDDTTGFGHRHQHRSLAAKQQHRQEDEDVGYRDARLEAGNLEVDLGADSDCYERQ